MVNSHANRASIPPVRNAPMCQRGNSNTTATAVSTIPTIMKVSDTVSWVLTISVSTLNILIEAGDVDIHQYTNESQSLL